MEDRMVIPEPPVQRERVALELDGIEFSWIDGSIDGRGHDFPLRLRTSAILVTPAGLVLAAALGSLILTLGSLTTAAPDRFGDRVDPGRMASSGVDTFGHRIRPMAPTVVETEFEHPGPPPTTPDRVGGRDVVVGHDPGAEQAPEVHAVLVETHLGPHRPDRCRERHPCDDPTHQRPPVPQDPEADGCDQAPARCRPPGVGSAAESLGVAGHPGSLARPTVSSSAAARARRSRRCGGATTNRSDSPSGRSTTTDVARRPIATVGAVAIRTDGSRSMANSGGLVLPTASTGSTTSRSGVRAITT
jgi:hypothetical protein